MIFKIEKRALKWLADNIRQYNICFVFNNIMSRIIGNETVRVDGVES